MKKRNGLLMILFFGVLFSFMFSLASVVALNNNFNLITLLGKKALRFEENVSFNNNSLINIKYICLGKNSDSGIDVCIDKWEYNITANMTETDPTVHESLKGITLEEVRDHNPNPHDYNYHIGIIGNWAQIDKTTSSIADITNRSHSLLTNIGEHTHAEIDDHIDTDTVVHTNAINLIKTSGDQEIGGIKTFTSFPILPSTTPNFDYQAVHKKYVDEVVILSKVPKEPVLDADLYQEPTNPSEGDRYLISDSQYHLIIDVELGMNAFYVDGDQTMIYQPNSKIKVKKSTGNNGYYTVMMSEYIPPPQDRTRIVVQENIPNGVADGEIHYCLGNNWRIIGVDFLVEWDGSQWVSDGTPQDGWFVLALDDATAWYFYVDSWIQTGKGQTYEAGNGLILDGNVFSVYIDPEGAGNKGLKFYEGKLRVNYDDETIGMVQNMIGSLALGVKSNSITNSHLAGGIADTKLSTITTAGKVSGSALTSLNSIPSGAGLIPTANLGTGTADSTKFLRGDRVWAVPPSAGEPSAWHVLNPINTNTWYIPYAIGCTALTTLTTTANRIYYIPFIPKKSVTITNLAVEVTTAKTGTGAIGIYNTNNYRPSTLLGYVTIDTSTTGVKSGSVSVSLTAGNLYWLAVINSGGATIRAVAVAGMNSIMGIATGGTAWNTYYYQSGSGGTLPSTASASAVGTGTTPAIYIRYSV